MNIPIFPLNGAVLFPGTSLPLNIFEDRYIEMVNYSLSKNRFIGMIQTNENGQLYEIGCIGKIHNFSETNDGRYLISLQGTSCFKILNELKQEFAFRQVNVNILEEYPSEIKFTDNQKRDLLDKYKLYAHKKKIDINIEEIKQIDLIQIVKFIAMVSPFKDIDKQVLLETRNEIDFYQRLLSILDIDMASDFSNKTIN